jgi:penicillin-binding protein 2
MAFGQTADTELGDFYRRLMILRVGLLLVVVLLGLRLWHLQIREGAYYRDLSENNRTRQVLLEPARGLIYDRHGVLLANNVPSFSVYVTLEDVKDREEMVKQLAGLLSLDQELIRKKLGGKGGKLLPRKIKDRMTLRDAVLVESHRLDLPGVTVEVESQRNYPGGVTAAHLLGYVGEISSEQLDKTEFSGLHQGSIVGQYGVEKSFDRHVRGQAGQKSIEVDALGHEKKSAIVQKPQSGNDLYLTIDIRLQKVAEELLGQEYGAIVAWTRRTAIFLPWPAARCSIRTCSRAN